MRLSRLLYRSATIANDVEALASGDPKRIERRLRNKIKGKLLAKMGVFRWLWR